MTNFEKVKAMSIDELAEFIDKQATEPIGDDFCSNYCEHREPNYGCKFEQKHNGPNCAYDDLELIIEWLDSEVVE